MKNQADAMWKQHLFRTINIIIHVFKANAASSKQTRALLFDLLVQNFVKTSIETYSLYISGVTGNNFQLK